MTSEIDDFSRHSLRARARAGQSSHRDLSLGAHGGAHAVNGADQLLLDGRLLLLGSRVQQLVGRQGVRVRVRVSVGVRLRMQRGQTVGQTIGRENIGG